MTAPLLCVAGLGQAVEAFEQLATATLIVDPGGQLLDLVFLELAVPGERRDRLTAVGGLLAMPRVHVSGDAEPPRSGAATARVKGAQRADRLNERLRGKVGDHLGLAAPAGEERGDPGDVGAVHRLELGQCRSGGASVVAGGGLMPISWRDRSGALRRRGSSHGRYTR
jgi:hypothetical protein